MSNRTEEREGWALLQRWNLANAVKQKFDFEAAHAAKQTGGVFSPVPFGSTNTTTTTNKAGGFLPTAALSLLALAGGGMGLAQLGGLMDQSPVVPAVIVEQKPLDTPAADAPAKVAPKIVEGVIDWEFDPDGGFSASGRSAD
jgi:hypothetical protein